MEPLSDFNQKLKIALKTEQKSMHPVISINKLAEYMTADPIRRRQIITSMKQDSDFKKGRYVEARNSILPYFQNGYDTDILEAAIQRINGKTPSSTWDADDNANSLLAIQSLLDTELPDLTDYNISKNELTIGSITIGGVEVFVRPDLYFRHKENGKYGALKVHIAKTPANRLEGQNRTYAATLLKYAMIQYGVAEKEIDINACLSLDVFLNAYSSASPTYKRMVASLEAACQEIAKGWE